jgi:hypothetical protein
MRTKLDVEIVTDESRNVIRILFHGKVTAAAMKDALTDMHEALRRVQPGFTVLTDLSDLETMELDCVESLTRIMENFKTGGVATVIRVIPDPAKDIGFNSLSLTHYRRGMKVLTCETLAEAERAIVAG